MAGRMVMQLVSVDPGVSLVQAKASAAERRASEAESEMLLLGRSLRDAEAAVVEWQVGPCPL